MNFSLFSHSREEYAVVVVIESGIVTASRVSFQKQIPRITAIARTPFTMTKKLSGDELLQNVTYALEQTCQKIFTSGMNVSRIHVVFSDPWALSHTKEIHISHDKVFVITRDFINNILDVEEDEFKKDILDTYTERFGSDVRVLEKNIFQARVNGYVMESYVGKKTQTFDISTHISLCAERIVSTITGCIEKHVHIPLSHVSFHTFPLISCVLLNHLYPNQDFVYMDVSPEATTVSVVRNNILSQSVSFPSGTRFVIRQIEKMLDVSSEIAVSTLHLVMMQKAHDDLTERVRTALMTAEKEWAIYFEDALKTLHTDIVLPTKLFLVTSDDMDAVYTEFIKTPQTDDTAVYRKEVHVVTLGETALTTQYEHSAHDFCDGHTALAVSFLK